MDFCVKSNECYVSSKEGSAHIQTEDTAYNSRKLRDAPNPGQETPELNTHSGCWPIPFDSYDTRLFFFSSKIKLSPNFWCVWKQLFLLEKQICQPHWGMNEYI